MEAPSIESRGDLTFEVSVIGQKYVDDWFITNDDVYVVVDLVTVHYPSYH